MRTGVKSLYGTIIYYDNMIAARSGKISYSAKTLWHQMHVKKNIYCNHCVVIDWWEMMKSR